MSSGPLDLLLPPTRLGPYRIGEVLGRGATSVVYRAWDETREMDVALKVLRREHVTDEDRRRFSAEAEKLARLRRHPNVVHIIDSGQVENETVIAMELVEGRPLSDWSWREQLDAREILQLALGLARGIAAIHAAGVIHRDLKPDNVLVGRDGQPVIIDFGIGKDIDADTDITRTRTFPGTLRYMAPEVISRRKPSVASDLYAFGAILYELRTGELFERDQIGRIDRAAAREGHGVARDLNRIIRQCLNEDCEQRLEYGKGLLADVQLALAPRSSFSRHARFALPAMAVLALVLYWYYGPALTGEQGLTAGHAVQLAVMVWLFRGARKLWREDGRTLELAYFWMFPWLTFLLLYAWKLLYSVGVWPRLAFVDAMLSNLNASAFLVCYLALVMPTRKVGKRRPAGFVRGCTALALLWVGLTAAALFSTDAVARFAVRVPAATFIALSLSLLSAGLHDRELRPSMWLRTVFFGYAIVQVAYVAFDDLYPSVLAGIYSFALVAKLLLHGHVTELVRSGRLHTYEGRASGRW